MAELFKILGIAFITAISAILLRSAKPELSFAVTVTGIIILILFILESMRSTFAIFHTITQLTGIDNGLVKLLLKIVGVGYLSEFSAGILQDFGTSAVADKVVLGGKITIVLLSMPVIESLLSLVRGFLQLV